MLKSTYTHGLIHHPHQKVDLFWGEGFVGEGFGGGGAFSEQIKKSNQNLIF